MLSCVDHEESFIISGPAEPEGEGLDPVKLI